VPLAKAFAKRLFAWFLVIVPKVWRFGKKAVRAGASQMIGNTGVS